MSLSFGGSGLVSTLKMPEHSQVVLGGLGFRLYFYISGLFLQVSGDSAAERIVQTCLYKAVMHCLTSETSAFAE